jgi:predicted peptidase
MKKITPNNFVLSLNNNVRIIVLITLFFVSKSFAFASFPQWVSGYPQTLNGASTIDIKVSMDQPGKVYYVCYNTQPSLPTAISVKKDASTIPGGIIVKSGVIDVTTANKETYAYLTKLKDNSTYYTYFVAENNSGEIQTEPKFIKNTLFERHAKKSYFSNMTVNAVIGYNIYFPEEYYKNPTIPNFPLMVFCHGAGEKCWPDTRVGDLNVAKRYGPPMLVDQGQEFPFIIVNAQCPYGDWDNIFGKVQPGKFVDEVVELMKASYNVDPSRIYVTGLSMGGGGTFSYLQNYPDKVAAAIPIAGWGSNGPEACKAKEVPVWAFHSNNDNMVGPLCSISVINAINNCNPAPSVPAKLTLYNPGYGHDCWTVTYNNTGYGMSENIYTWLTKHVKGNPPEDGSNNAPKVYAGKDLLLHEISEPIVLRGFAIDEEDKTLSYKWTKKSGPDVSLAGEFTSTLSLTDLLPGKYIFRLTATDNGTTKKATTEIKRSSYDEITLDIPEVITSTNNGIDNEKTSMVNPNPFRDQINITLDEGNTSGNVDLSITDIQGRVVYTASKAVTGTASVSITSSELNLNKGIYYLRINDNQRKEQVVKISKE